MLVEAAKLPVYDYLVEGVGEDFWPDAYDPAVPDSINVATTLAGLGSGIVVSPALAERFGADRFLWASDFPHNDAKYPGVVDELRQMALAHVDAGR